MTTADLSSDAMLLDFWKPNLLHDQENDFERDFTPIDEVFILSPEEHFDVTTQGLPMLDCDVSHPDTPSFVGASVEGCPPPISSVASKDVAFIVLSLL
jgi:hypothetical protein